MCGIISYIGKQDALQILIKGLKCVEYRGYDSAGIAIGDEQHPFRIERSVGYIEDLIKHVSPLGLKGHVGIGHTRWATHGGIFEKNAHPHVSNDKKFILVHNGVIENYAVLKATLLKAGVKFYSDTDTEVLVNLIAQYYQQLEQLPTSQRFEESVRKSLAEVQGTYGIVVICTDCPNELIGVRKSSPLVLGINPDGLFLGSDVGAFSGHIENVVYLSDHEMVHIKGMDYQITDLMNGSVTSPSLETIDREQNTADLGNFPNYAKKEIFEQGTALGNMYLGRFSSDGSSAHFGGLQITPYELRQVERILLLGCGSSLYACKIGASLIETYARIPVDVEYASEFCYRNAPLNKNTLVFVVSQSGETLDTLNALREVKRKGFPTLAITNVVGSTIAREAGCGIYLHLGMEVGVAATKSFTGQVGMLALLALYLGRMRDMSFTDGRQFVQALQSLPQKVDEVLALCDEPMQKLAKTYVDYQHCFFIGRQMLYPIAIEGALKLKELSYMHAEAYPAGELKHGALALIDPSVLTIVLATNEEVMGKNISNMMEIKARHGKVIAIGLEGCEIPQKAYDEVIYLPKVYPALLPIITVLPLQLFAYYLASERKCNVDKPRNLAKSVTVE